MEKLSALMFTVFRHSQSTLFCVADVGTFDMRDKMAGGGAGRIGEKSSWTPQELDPQRGLLSLALQVCVAL